MTKYYIVGGVVAAVFALTFGFAYFAHAASVFQVFQGGTGQSTFTQGVTYSPGGTNAFQTTPTTTASCSGSASCTIFTILGSTPITITGGSGAGTIATSGPDTAGQVLYYTTTNGYPAKANGEATSSLSVTGPITFSGTLFAQLGGVGGVFGCTTASAIAVGCLASSDWSNFNNKVSSTSLSAVYPLSYTPSTGVFTTVATSSENCTVTCFLSHNVSQWTNDAGYLTSAILSLGNYATTTGENISLSTSTQIFQGATFGQTVVVSPNGIVFTPVITGTLAAASSTLLGNSNTFSGNNIFSASTTVGGQLNLQGASSTLFSASNIWDSALSSGQCVQAGTGGLLTTTGSACGSGSGAVSSVSNSDGTLTISPTTGAVVASLNLMNANTWNGQQTFNTSPVIGTTTSGVLVGGNNLIYASTTNGDLLVGPLAGSSVSTTSATARDNTIIGYQSGNSIGSTNSSNVLVGYQSGKFSTGSDNTLMGTEAGGEFSSSGSNNTGVGFNALLQLTSGRANTAVGYQAGDAVQAGTQNTSVGVQAGGGNNGGSNVTAVGYEAGEAGGNNLYASSTFIGAFTNFGASAGVLDTTELGASAGFNNTGWDSTFIGENSGQNNTSGNNNITLGYNALVPSPTASNQVNLGNIIFATNTAATSSSNSAIPTLTGDVYIGTSTVNTSNTFAVQNTTSGNSIFSLFSSTGAPEFNVSNAGAVTTQLGNALVLSAGAGSTLGAYGGASACSANNFVTTISAIGATTCGTASISGVNLGSNLNSLSNDGATLSGSSYNGSATVSNWALNLNNANTWNATQTFNNHGVILSATTSALLSTNTSGLIVSTSSIGINLLSANSIVVTTASPLGGAATVPLGGTLALTCSTCNTSSLSGSGVTGMMTAWSGTNSLIATSTVLGGFFIATTTTATSTFNGSFVVATTSPNAFAVQDQYGTQDVLADTASTTGPIFAVEATTTGNPILFSEDQYGHLTASSTGATPTVSSCGTGSPALTAGSNDATGDVTTGTAATACTITFAHAYSTIPEVIVTGASTVSFPAVTARSTTAFTLGISGAVTGDDISYLVIMP